MIENDYACRVCKIVLNSRPPARLLLHRSGWPLTPQDQHRQEPNSMEGGSRTPHEQGSRGARDRETAAGEPGAELFRPNYIYTPRLVGRLAIGELAVEPVLGPARVARVRQPEEEDPDGSHTVVSWRDEHGPGTAVGRYPADRSFDVRMPAHEDRLLVRRGIDQAKWHGREITDETARLIASHLHPGERSALHRFMLDGSVDERLYDELEAVAQHQQYVRQWVDALARYCLTREETGPIKAWTRQATRRAEARAEEWLSAAGISVDALHHHAKMNGDDTHTEADRHKPYRDLLGQKTMQTETAVQLIEAAFTLGMEVGRSPARAPGARRLRERTQRISA